MNSIVIKYDKIRESFGQRVQLEELVEGRILSIKLYDNGKLRVLSKTKEGGHVFTVIKSKALVKELKHTYKALRGVEA